MAIKITVTGQGNLNRLIDDMGDLEINPHEIVEKYKPVAKSKAPVADDALGGGTRDAIITVKPSKKQGILRLYQPQKRLPQRPYHLWMHREGKFNIAPYIKNGKGNFMNEVAILISQDIDNQIRNNTNKL